MSKAVSAVIDIGATHGGHGISFYHEYKEKPLSISHKRSVPLLLWDSSPCLLFTKDKVLDSLYYEAEDKYIHLGEKNDWYFFTSFLRSISNSEVCTLFYFIGKKYSCRYVAVEVRNRRITAPVAN